VGFLEKGGLPTHTPIYDLGHYYGLAPANAGVPLFESGRVFDIIDLKQAPVSAGHGLCGAV